MTLITEQLAREPMSDAEWEAYIDLLIKAHAEGTCGPNCAQCESGDALERWLS